MINTEGVKNKFNENAGARYRNIMAACEQELGSFERQMNSFLHPKEGRSVGTGLRLFLPTGVSKEEVANLASFNEIDAFCKKEDCGVRYLNVDTKHYLGVIIEVDVTKSYNGFEGSEQKVDLEGNPRVEPRKNFFSRIFQH